MVGIIIKDKLPVLVLETCFGLISRLRPPGRLVLYEFDAQVRTRTSRPVQRIAFKIAAFPRASGELATKSYGVLS